VCWRSCSCRPRAAACHLPVPACCCHMPGLSSSCASAGGHQDQSCSSCGPAGAPLLLLLVEGCWGGCCAPRCKAGSRPSVSRKCERWLVCMCISCLLQALAEAVCLHVVGIAAERGVVPPCVCLDAQQTGTKTAQQSLRADSLSPLRDWSCCACAETTIVSPTPPACLRLPRWICPFSGGRLTPCPATDT
jgi:hypothetical protein